jgi:hypothetical protein
MRVSSCVTPNEFKEMYGYRGTGDVCIRRCFGIRQLPIDALAAIVDTVHTPIMGEPIMGERHRVGPRIPL